jgi:hypothetical protein
MLWCLVSVCTWICRFVFEHLDEAVKQNRNDCTKSRSDPVYPMVVIELADNNVRTEGTSWVERAACEHDASEFGNEKGKTDADWSQEGAFVFFGGKHEAKIVGQKADTTSVSVCTYMVKIKRTVQNISMNNPR